MTSIAIRPSQRECRSIEVSVAPAGRDIFCAPAEARRDTQRDQIFSISLGRQVLSKNGWSGL